MTQLGIIGGTGLTNLENLEITHREMMKTPYGAPSGPLTHGRLAGKEVVFLARHGYDHSIPPHKVNFRANIWAMKEIGVRKVVAVAAVGGIRSDMKPGSLAFPDQIIDYTWSRKHTFFDEKLSRVTHIEFTDPYCEELRESLIRCARESGLQVTESGVYGATQGPRLETAMEINRMERDGCDMVGMTGMPECALARELDLCYATCAVVANWAAGRGQGPITMDDIDHNIKEGMGQIYTLVEKLITLI